MGLICTPYGYSGAAKVSGRVTYQSTILADKPVAYWPLNETSGTVANDLSGNGFNMAYQNAPTLGAAAIAPGLGKSVSLNGSSQFVELAAPPTALQLMNGSFEGWWIPSVIPTAFNSGGELITAAYTNSTTNFLLGFGGTSANGYYQFGAYGNGGWSQANGSAVPANAAAHLVGTNDGATVNLYVNGKLMASGSSATFTPANASIFIGAGDSGGYFTGLISNVAMYNTILTAAQVLNHYNAGIA